VQRLHVLDITTGTARPSSLVVIRASVPGTADGFADGMITFDPAIHDQRGVLVIANDTVYITWASHCDTGPIMDG